MQHTERSVIHDRLDDILQRLEALEDSARKENSPPFDLDETHVCAHCGNRFFPDQGVLYVDRDMFYCHMCNTGEITPNTSATVHCATFAKEKNEPPTDCPNCGHALN